MTPTHTPTPDLTTPRPWRHTPQSDGRGFRMVKGGKDFLEMVATDLDAADAALVVDSVNECDSLRATVAALCEQQGVCRQQELALRAERDQLKAANERLMAAGVALAPYVQHDPRCSARRGVKCSCGLTALLKDGER